MLRLLTLAALLASSQASPVERKDLGGIINGLECKVVDIVVTALNQYSSATPFCSSFLGISTKTLTATSTTSTFTTTTIVSQAPTSIITAPAVTVTETAVDTITTCIPQAYKRGPNQKQSTSSKSSPTPALPSCLTAFATAEISTACSCLSIPTPSTTLTVPFTTTPIVQTTTTTTPLTTYTPTVIVTTTSTSTDNVCPTPTSCNNQGVQWAYYGNAPYNSDSTYSAFLPESYKDETPGYQSVTSTLGGIDTTSNPITLYGSTQTFPLTYFALNHRGYIFAEVTGTYTFSLSVPDDISMMWVGPTAYSGWTRANANVLNYYGSGATRTYQMDLLEGEYYALRIMFGQAQGGAIFAASITAPDGTVILDSDSSPSPYLIQYSCDGILAPEYPAFGSET